MLIIENAESHSVRNTYTSASMYKIRSSKTDQGWLEYLQEKAQYDTSGLWDFYTWNNYGMLDRKKFPFIVNETLNIRKRRQNSEAKLHQPSRVPISLQETSRLTDLLAVEDLVEYFRMTSMAPKQTRRIVTCRFHPRCNNEACRYEHPPRCEVWPQCNKETLASNNLDRIPRGWEMVEKIIYNPNEILGKGSLGTTVFRGRFNERPVAVKRIHTDEYNMTLFDREIKLLRESDSHKNIIRYYITESDKNFRYIALELCACSLYDFITNPIKTRIEFIRAWADRTEMLRQATEGIAHLHQINIMHRDLKPQNILLTYADNAGNYRILISDFGLCKKLPYGQNSVSYTTPSGSSGWLAPEILGSKLPDAEIEEIFPDGKPSITKACDVFSLGCVFYFVLTDGEHPFGHIMRRQEKVLTGRCNITALKNKLDNTTIEIASHCIECMISHDYKLRPSIEAVLEHPYFWENSKRLNFLADVSDRIWKEKEKKDSEIVDLLINRIPDVIPENWLTKEIDPEIYRDKPFHLDIRGLLRLIRNTRNHYHDDLSGKVHSLIEVHMPTEQSKQPIQAAILNYFTSRFPKLFMHVYITMNPCSLEIVFRDYYPESVRKFFEKINPFLFPKKKKIVDNLSSDAQKVDEQKQDEPEQNYDKLNNRKNSTPPPDPRFNYSDVNDVVRTQADDSLNSSESTLSQNVLDSEYQGLDDDQNKEQVSKESEVAEAISSSLTNLIVIKENILTSESNELNDKDSDSGADQEEDKTTADTVKNEGKKKKKRGRRGGRGRRKPDKK